MSGAGTRTRKVPSAAVYPAYPLTGNQMSPGRPMNCCNAIRRRPLTPRLPLKVTAWPPT